MKQNIELLTITEAAEILKIHPQTVYRWCYSGRIKSFVIGRKRRIRLDDLINLINK